MLPDILDPSVTKRIESNNNSRQELELCTNFDQSPTEFIFPEKIKDVKFTETIILGTLLYNAYKKFQNDISIYSEFNSSLKAKAEEYFNLTIHKLSDVFPSSLIVSLTDSKSIYFRYYKDHFLCHMEVFYDYDKTEDDIESIATLYENQSIVLKQYGDLNHVFDKIKEKIYSNQRETFIDSNQRETF